MRRLILKIGLVSAAVVGSVLTGAAPSSAAVPPFTDSTTWAYLSNPASGMVVDVAGQSRAERASIWTWPFHGDLNQHWEVKSVPNTPYYTIAATHSRMCLDVRWGNWNNGTEVWQWPCHGGDPQLWKPETFAVDQFGYSTFRLRNKGSQRCLEVPGGVAPQGAVLRIWDCHGGRNQEWRQGNFLSNPTRGHVADIRDGNTASGAQAWMWPFHGGANQEVYAPYASGFGAQARRFSFLHSGKCLGVQGRSPQNGALVVQLPCDLADTNQVWLQERVLTDKWGHPINRYRNKLTGKCLDIWVHDAPVGARLLQWDCHTGWNQQWRIG
ncbi:Ricin-type beta-trefoil lectin domain-like [Actinokineospora alba]|uniref:Ricin-type beta-trefoil lectin domain-like n=1 Tax=Actinokineospora alba TaxID=504798 RepID=A0A1H0W518_9PSEU|nr:RICIN domain-containing protein [Actinokineospora alba]TDP67858.1 ricin-type beta-trefoil lectin protein [Actinokineospora alba]SDI73177.1 Ricin-type beta-trefoil lectin domain-like [Actinokineospora alba]SDP85575.1 Ricin-type beta-trefoil lectin domain-like [Actinokineospora alba]